MQESAGWFSSVISLTLLSLSLPSCRASMETGLLRKKAHRNQWQGNRTRTYSTAQRPCQQPPEGRHQSQIDLNGTVLGQESFARAPNLECNALIQDAFDPVGSDCTGQDQTSQSQSGTEKNPGTFCIYQPLCKGCYRSLGKSHGGFPCKVISSNPV
ncbi:hypothetical protein KIL84_014097 [Mauremys mutica]|uniref:Uncharacterized protein n=1 Tax=Mauremys mutica TaxID=74926 RepID=A0A9D4B7E2_9SAUR|nr:hypothetical protein KIL84_014097 [Mauremys mutica]